MASKPTSVPGEVDKLIAHQARLLTAPRIVGHYARLAEQGRAASWSLEDYLAAVWRWNPMRGLNPEHANAFGMLGSQRSR